MASCPICQEPFGAITTNGATVAMCKQCDGMWFEPGAFDRVNHHERKHLDAAYERQPRKLEYLPQISGIPRGSHKAGVAGSSFRQFFSPARSLRP